MRSAWRSDTLDDRYAEKRSGSSFGVYRFRLYGALRGRAQKPRSLIVFTL